MRKNLKYYVIGLTLLMVSIVSCDQATQEVSPIVVPDDSYPVVEALTLVNTGTINEGDTIVFTITLNKPTNTALTFGSVLDTIATTLVEHVDFDFVGGTVEAWETEGELWIISYADVNPEPVGVVAFQLIVNSLAEKYLLHPDNVFPDAEVTIYPPLWLDIIMDWDSDDDIDFVIYKDDETNLMHSAYSDQGATLAQPEGDNSIKLADVGTYYVDVMHWGAPSFDYTFTIGKPDGIGETFTGTFTSDNLRAYYLGIWTAWGGAYHSYRVLKVVNDGTSFTVTKYDALTSADYVSTADLVGTWSGTDGVIPSWIFGTTTVDVTDVGGEPHIYGLNEGWMTVIWGETVTSGDPVEMIVYSNGDVVIPYNYYWTTDYAGDPYDYYIYGAGTYDAGTGLHLEYEMDQEGFLCGGWCYDNGYSDYQYFHADLTKGKQQVQSTNIEVLPSFVKPDTKANSKKKEIIK
ncbi:MAG: hypothetical protein KAQ75_05510 [Bacteroidales bacterium]|nr:hypothetical protein [Bacteroidales bacterium]